MIYNAYLLWDFQLGYIGINKQVFLFKFVLHDIPRMFKRYNSFKEFMDIVQFCNEPEVPACSEAKAGITQDAEIKLFSEGFKDEIHNC